MKKTKITSLLLAAVLIFTGCSNQEDEKLKTDAAGTNSTALEDQTLDIGINANFPPYEYYEGNDVVGIDVEIAKAVSQYLGYDIKFHEMEFGNLIAAIESGKIDGAISGITVSGERQKSVNFSQPYTKSVQLIIVKENSPISKIDDLQNKKIGTQFGTTGDIYSKEDFGEDNVQSFSNPQDAVLALVQGKVDAVILDKEPALNFVNTNQDLKTLATEYAEEDFAIALNKNNEKLQKDVNTALSSLTEDGTIEEIIDKYIPKK